jgi:hypothetical protein
MTFLKRVAMVAFTETAPASKKAKPNCICGTKMTRE